MHPEQFHRWHWLTFNVGLSPCLPTAIPTNSNVDVFSRLPLSHHSKVVQTPAGIIFLLDCLNSTPVTAALIKQWTQNDPILSKLKAHL